MAKPLRQITFAFEDDADNTAAAVPVEEVKKEIKIQPAVITIEKNLPPAEEGP